MIASSSPEADAGRQGPAPRRPPLLRRRRGAARRRRRPDRRGRGGGDAQPARRARPARGGRARGGRAPGPRAPRPRRASARCSPRCSSRSRCSRCSVRPSRCPPCRRPSCSASSSPSSSTPAPAPARSPAPAVRRQGPGAVRRSLVRLAAARPGLGAGQARRPPLSRHRRDDGCRLAGDGGRRRHPSPPHLVRLHHHPRLRLRRRRHRARDTARLPPAHLACSRRSSSQTYAVTSVFHNQNDLATYLASAGPSCCARTSSRGAALAGARRGGPLLGRRRVRAHRLALEPGRRRHLVAGGGRPVLAPRLPALEPRRARS